MRFSFGSCQACATYGREATDAVEALWWPVGDTLLFFCTPCGALARKRLRRRRFLYGSDDYLRFTLRRPRPASA